jgi:hypothetical protein
MPKKNDAGSKAEHHYFRVVITYSDGETSGNRVFKDRAKAERWAARQEKSKVVKKAVLGPFVRQQHGARPPSKHPKTVRPYSLGDAGDGHRRVEAKISGCGT